MTGRDDTAAQIVHTLTCGRCRMDWSCGGLGEDDYAGAEGIAPLLAAARADERERVLGRIEALAEEWEDDEAYSCRNASECVRCVSFQRVVIRLRALVADLRDSGAESCAQTDQPDTEQHTPILTPPAEKGPES